MTCFLRRAHAPREQRRGLATRRTVHLGRIPFIFRHASARSRARSPSARKPGAALITLSGLSPPPPANHPAASRPLPDVRGCSTGFVKCVQGAGDPASRRFTPRGTACYRTHADEKFDRRSSQRTHGAGHHASRTGASGVPRLFGSSAPPSVGVSRLRARTQKIRPFAGKCVGSSGTKAHLRPPRRHPRFIPKPRICRTV